jgi:replication factor C large subunit
MLPWTKKYQPKYSSEIVGHSQVISNVKTNLSKKPIILYGPPGIGKTCLVYAIAKDLNLEVFELNASESRNKKSVEEIMGNSANQMSLFSKGKIILIDDVDAVSGRRDRGGVAAMAKIMLTSPHPVIFTCSDPWSDKLKPLRKKTNIIELSMPKKDLLIQHLEKICKLENISFTQENLKILIKANSTDFRGLINDLQSHSVNHQLDTSDHAARKKSQDIQFALRKILKGKKWDDIYNVFQDVNMDLNECTLWLEENLPIEYKGKSLSSAFDCLSRSDVYNGRIRRWQHWRFLVYMNLLLTVGVGFAKTETNPEFTQYKRSTRILKIWMANMRNGKRKSIAEKLADVTHTSKKRALKDSLPFLQPLMFNQKMQEELELNEEEISWLQK